MISYVTAYFKLYIQRLLTMFCCDREMIRTEIIPQIYERTEEDQTFFEACNHHSRQIEFLCLNPECRDAQNILLCNYCLKEHQNHAWITKEDFLTDNIRKILMFGTAQSDIKLDGALQVITAHLDAFTEEFARQMALIKMQFTDSIHKMQQKYKLKAEDSLQSKKNIITKILINSKIAQKLIKIYKIQQKKYEWIDVMQQYSVKIIQQISKSCRDLNRDLQNVMDAQKWQFRQKFMDQFKQFQQHLHFHSDNDKTYYKFSNHDKHMNIGLDANLLQASYMRSIPSKPVVISNQYISQFHNKFGFHIVKLQSKAIFFESTIIFIGLCNPSIVKSVGLRKINQLNKGAYLISSEGWCFHHEDQAFNNKEIVGWGFSQGDKIDVEIVFGTYSRIIFSKKSRFFTNTFEMPLNLNQFQVKRLRPCISFDAEQGAIVRIYDNDPTA